MLEGFKKENKQVRKMRRERVIMAIKNFFESVGLGVLKSTPFGHIVSEIENNLKHENGGIGKIDKIRFVVWVFAAGLIFHFIAGIKHLLADLGFAEELQSGRIAATISLILSVVAIIAAFVWIMF